MRAIAALLTFSLIGGCAEREITSPPDKYPEVLTTLPYYRLTEHGGMCFDWSDDGERILIRREYECLSVDAVTGATLSQHIERDHFNIGYSNFGAQYVKEPIQNSIVFFAAHKTSIEAGIYMMDSGGYYELLLTPLLSSILAFSTSSDYSVIVYYEWDWRRRYSPYLRIWRRGEGVTETHHPGSLGITTYTAIKADFKGKYFDYSCKEWENENHSIQRWTLADSSRTVICETKKKITGFDRSADGSWYVLALLEELDGEYPINLFLLNPDRPDTTYRITTLTSRQVARPVFSPDGSQVAFDLKFGHDYWEVYLIDLKDFIAQIKD